MFFNNIEYFLISKNICLLYFANWGSTIYTFWGLVFSLLNVEVRISHVNNYFENNFNFYIILAHIYYIICNFGSIVDLDYLQLLLLSIELGQNPCQKKLLKT